MLGGLSPLLKKSDVRSDDPREYWNPEFWGWGVTENGRGDISKISGLLGVCQSDRGVSRGRKQNKKHPKTLKTKKTHTHANKLSCHNSSCTRVATT